MNKIASMMAMASVYGVTDIWNNHCDIVAGNIDTPISRPHWKELQSKEEREAMLEKARAKRERKAVKRSNNVQ